jgi:hypothetical protein
MPYPVHPEMLEWYTSRADTDEGLRAILAQLQGGGGGGGAGAASPPSPQHPPRPPLGLTNTPQPRQPQPPDRSLRAERQRLRSLVAAARRLDEGVAAGGLLGQLELAMRLARLYSPRQLEAMLGAAQRVRENVARASRLVEVLDGVEQRERERAERAERERQERQQREEEDDGRTN